MDPIRKSSTSALDIEIINNPTLPSAKIVATIGPRKSTAYDNLETILGSGSIRVNLAFAFDNSVEIYIKLFNRIRKARGDSINILLDAVGPRVKLLNLEQGVQIPTGKSFLLQYEPENSKKLSSPDVLLTIFPGLGKFCSVGDKILFAEGKFFCKVTKKIEPDGVECIMERGGLVKKRGINLPTTNLQVPALSKSDQSLLKVLLKLPQVDMIALSFVRNAKDVLFLREFLKQNNRPDVRIMSKIETQPAVDAIEEISKVSDALMVARGDLWCELRDPWTLPKVTLDIIDSGHKYGIPVVTATQTLSSMVSNPLPSRSEVDELYFLLKNNSDCIMGSEEFAIGKHPQAVVHAIRNVAKSCQTMASGPPRVLDHKNLDRNLAGILWAESEKRVRAIFIISSNGNFLKEVFKHRPSKPVFCITNKPSTAHYCQLFPVYSVLAHFDESHSASVISHAVLEKLNWRSHDDTVLLIVNHVGPCKRTFRCSRIEEIPLPNPIE